MHAYAWWIFGAVLLAAFFLAILFAIYFSIPSRRQLDLKERYSRKHALVTGGSKGIGKELALSLLSRGTNLTIFARNVDDLKKATEELQYSPAKFALRGFADALHMELLPYKISVSVLYPPNTDTEGFKVELETMPIETQLISASAGLFRPKDVAEAHINDIVNGEYSTSIGLGKCFMCDEVLDGWMLGVLTAGAAPEPNLFRAVVQCLLAGVFRLVLLLYLGSFQRLVKKCYLSRQPRATASN